MGADKLARVAAGVSGAQMRAAIWFLLPSLLVLAYLSGRLGDAYEPIKLGLFGCAAGGLLLAGARCSVPKAWRLWSLCAGLVLALSSALAHDWGYALMGSAQRFQGAAAALLALLAFTLAAGASGGERLALRQGAALALLLSTLLLALQTAGFDPLATGAARVPGALGNAVVQAQALLLLAALCLDASKGVWRVVLSVSALLALALTATRAAWLGLAVASLCMYLARARSAPQLSTKRAAANRGASLVALGSGAWLIAASVLLTGLVVLLGSLRPESASQRWQLWQSGVAALRHDLQAQPMRLLVGHGPDQGFVALIPAWKQAHAAATPGHLDRVHQWALDLWLSYGLLGLLLAAWAGYLLLHSRQSEPGRWMPGQSLLSQSLPGRRDHLLALGLLAWWLSLQTGFALSADTLLAALAFGLCLTGRDVPTGPEVPTAVAAHGDSAAARYRRALGALLIACAACLWLLPSSVVPALRRPEQALAAFLSAQRILAAAAQASPGHRSAALLLAQSELARAVALDALRSEYRQALRDVKAARVRYPR